MRSCKTHAHFTQLPFFLPPRRTPAPPAALPNFSAHPGGEFAIGLGKGLQREVEGVGHLGGSCVGVCGAGPPQVQGQVIPVAPRCLRPQQASQPGVLAAPTRQLLAGGAVAMRCRETPVNKLCLDSGARAQGLFA